MEEKKKNGSKVVIVILIILLLLSLFYIAYVEFCPTYKNNVKETTTKKEKLDVNSVLVQKLFNIFKYDSCIMSTNNLNNSNALKLRIAYDNLEKKLINDGTLCNNYLATPKTSYEPQCGGDGVDTDSVSAKDLENKVKELFGSDYKVKHESFGTGHTLDTSCYFMKYYKDEGIYVHYLCEGGGTCGFKNHTLKSAYKEGNKLFIITELKTVDEVSSNKVTKVTFEFKYDKEVASYVFVKAIEE